MSLADLLCLPSAFFYMSMWKTLKNEHNTCKALFQHAGTHANEGMGSPRSPLPPSAPPISRIAEVEAGTDA